MRFRTRYPRDPKATKRMSYDELYREQDRERDAAREAALKAQNAELVTAQAAKMPILWHDTTPFELSVDTNGYLLWRRLGQSQAFGVPLSAYPSTFRGWKKRYRHENLTPELRKVLAARLWVDFCRQPLRLQREKADREAAVRRQQEADRFRAAD